MFCVLRINMNSYTNLAKQSVETYFTKHAIMDTPKNLPKEFYDLRAGVFVTIFNGKDLRGCIGTYMPTEKNIADEIIQNAISAAANDYRFEPITIDELPKLTYEVSVLSAPEEIKDKRELDPQKFGVLVKSGHKSGLLLPDLKGVDTTEKQIKIACQKAGINYPKEKIEIYKFTVKKYS